MPTSHLGIIAPVVNLVKSFNPASILDVGCGFGKYGLLFREYLEVSEGRYAKKDWTVKIDALEIFPNYLTPVHKYVYDNVIIGDALKADYSPYDVVFFGDIIEHLEKEDALDLISRVSKTSQVLISTPNGFYKQGEHFGNKYEIHKCGFCAEDFERFNAKILNVGIMLLVVIKCQK